MSKKSLRDCQRPRPLTYDREQRPKLNGASLCTARWTRPLSRRRRGLTARLPRRKLLAWAMQRGGSSVSKGAPRRRSCGDTARPLRTLGPGSAQRWLRIVPAAAANPFGSAFPWRPILLTLFPARKEGDAAKGLHLFTADGACTDQRLLRQRSWQRSGLRIVVSAQALDIRR